MTVWLMHNPTSPRTLPRRSKSKAILRAHMNVLARRLFMARCPPSPRGTAAADVLVKRRSPTPH
jgi:hypothetical protein